MDYIFNDLNVPRLVPLKFYSLLFHKHEDTQTNGHVSVFTGLLTSGSIHVSL